MGHHSFLVGETYLVMKDIDVELVRHFLVRGATEVAPSIANELHKWAWIGPGVWTDVDEQILASAPNVFEAALDLVKGFGNEIPLDYLKVQVQLPDGVNWGGAIPTRIVAREFQRLSDFLKSTADLRE